MSGGRGHQNRFRDGTYLKRDFSQRDAFVGADHDAGALKGLESGVLGFHDI